MTRRAVELADFLLARVADDEEEAFYVHHENCDWLDELPCDCPWPERIKAGFEAKRRIVREHQPDFEWYAAWDRTHPDYAPLTIWCPTCSEDPQADGALPKRYPCPTLRFLALPYANHPDYRQEWKL